MYTSWVLWLPGPWVSVYWVLTVILFTEFNCYLLRNHCVWASTRSWVRGPASWVRCQRNTWETPSNILQKAQGLVQWNRGRRGSVSTKLSLPQIPRGTVQESLEWGWWQVPLPALLPWLDLIYGECIFCPTSFSPQRIKVILSFSSLS